MTKKTDELRIKIAERLRMARDLAGLTQRQAAQLMDMHRPTISEIEAGRRRVSAEELLQFADIYGVAVSWLADENEDGSVRLDERVKLAARELGKLQEDDLDRLLVLLKALRKGDSE